MKRTRKNLVLALIVLFLTPSLSPAQGLELGRVITVSDQEEACASDSDCLVVADDCGGCSCGLAVNKSFQDKFIKQREQQCKNFNFGCDSSCMPMGAVCKDSRCILTPLSRSQ